MSSNNPIIESFLATLKERGQSSPCDWHHFHQFLIRKKLVDQPPPPVPLILAASDESNATKHGRLGEQLEWALRNQCLAEAIAYLEKLSNEQWNTCALDEWHKDSYLKF